MTSTPTPTGTAVPTDGGFDLVFPRTFQAPIEDVWASVTESERTARWFGPWRGEAGPEQMAIDSESSARMAALLQVLPEKQREIIILRVVVGMSAEETAEAVGSTAGAVRVAQHRALSRLKAEITSAGQGRDYA